MRTTLLLAALLIASVPYVATAHPPVADPQDSCLLRTAKDAPPLQPVNVPGTLTYLAPLGTSNPACAMPPPSPPIPPALAYTDEWGSHANTCAGILGPIPGAYCGPIVPALGTATCTWAPVFNTVQTALTIGFDQDGDGLVRWGGGDVYTVGPFPQGTFRVPNFYNVPAQVIGYPTSLNGGMLAPGDTNRVVCVTP